MLIKKTDPCELKSSEITEESLYSERRRFLALSGVTALAYSTSTHGEAPNSPASEFPNLTASALSTEEEKTHYKDIARYNNFYEFGIGKEDPEHTSHSLKTRPWSLSIEGEAHKPKIVDIETILHTAPLEERIYRLRCVEGWSMVIPWVGFSLAWLLKQVEPTNNAKFVEFTTRYAPDQMPEQRTALLDWPYVEGLRIDEAYHPLTILAVGLYGKLLLNQNGAPIRLVVPWKYGFKSIKSIVRIRLTATPPLSTWQKAIPSEYGFYANVNPDVHHPRWSQAKERRIGDFLKRPTLMFNGYAEEVAGLYTGMDLHRFF